MVTFTNLTAATDTVDRATYSTASVSPTAGRLIVVDIHAYVGSGSTNPPQPTVTGNGITYELVRAQNVDTSGSDRATMWRFRGMSASPSSEVISIAFGATLAGACSWSVNQSSSDVDTTGTNGSGAFISANTVGATAGAASGTATVNYAQAIATGNTCLAAVAYQQSSTSGTPRTNWTELSETAGGIAALETQQRVTGADTETAASATFTSSRWGIIASEIKAAGGTTVNGTATGAFGFAGSAVVASLPGSIGGVEPEWHGHNPALLASNGALYRLTESDLASGNHPMMMKSSDGGKTWAEVDSGNRPTAQDLESSWIDADGTTIIATLNRDSTVWWCPFDTTTDLWGTQETIDSSLASSSVEQSVCHVQTSNGQWWIFYSDKGATFQQLSYRRRTGTNTYGTKVTGAFGSTSVDLAGAYAVLGASDVTHIVYTDATNHHAYWRTLTTGGTLSSATQLDSAGTYNFSSSIVDMGTTNVVYYDDGGVEAISTVYADTSGILQLVQIVGGTPQTEEQVSSAAVDTNPGSTTHDSITAHIAVDGTDLHVIWADATSGDLLHRRRDGDTGTWDSIDTLWSSGSQAVYYAYCAVHTYSGGSKVLGYVVDRGDHGNDISDVWYDELELPTTVNGTASAAFGFTATAAGIPETFGTAVASFGFTATASGIITPVAGQAVAIFGFTGSAAGVDRALGVAVATFGFTATASGVDRALGAAVASFGFTATAAGVDRVLGVAVGSFGFTGTTSGSRRVLGQTAAAFGFTATGSGFAGSPPVQGQATAAFGFTATGSGVPETFGVAAVSFGYTGAAAGVDRALGVAVASFGFTATSQGRPRHLGVAVGSFGFTATASGVRETFGAAVALLGFTGTASGVAGAPPVQGQATAAFGFTALSSGTPRVLGVTVAVLGFTAAATGRRRTPGAAAAGFAGTATAAGTSRTLGVAVASFGFTGVVIIIVYNVRTVGVKTRRYSARTARTNLSATAATPRYSAKG